MSDLGSDLSCIDDLTDDCAVVTDRVCFIQAIVRRLTTPRGTLIDDPNYGEDVTAWINDDMSPSDIGALQAAVGAECLKDERCLAASAVAVLQKNGVLKLTITLQDADGPFRLVLAVSDVSAKVLEVT